MIEISKLFISSVIILCMMLVPGMNLLSQEIKKVEGVSQVKLEDNMTREETRLKAKDLAMIMAIENGFGTYVEQEAEINVQDGLTRFNIIGNTSVKGEWIETLDLSYGEETRWINGSYGKESEIWITCEIKGKAREALPRANIQYEALRCPSIDCKTTEYESGESFYLAFKSPVAGYLSIFLIDEETAFRILPYGKMQAGYRKSVPIEEDKDYVFFSKKNRYFQDETVDELELFTEEQYEYNDVVLVFSEEPYIKPALDPEEDQTDYKEGHKIPGSLPVDDFEKWLSSNKAVLDTFFDRKVRIRIVND